MSTLAPSPLPHHRFSLPRQRRLSQLGFLAGIAGAAIAWPLASTHLVSLFVLVVVWYSVSYALPRVVEHEQHRRQWLAHALLFPLAAIAAAFLIDAAWARHAPEAVVLGLIAGAVFQALATHAVLRGVVHDQFHDLRRRIGVE